MRHQYYPFYSTGVYVKSRAKAEYITPPVRKAHFEDMATLQIHRCLQLFTSCSHLCLNNCLVNAPHNLHTPANSSLHLLSRIINTHQQTQSFAASASSMHILDSALLRSITFLIALPLMFSDVSSNALFDKLYWVFIVDKVFVPNQLFSYVYCHVFKCELYN